MSWKRKQIEVLIIKEENTYIHPVRPEILTLVTFIFIFILSTIFHLLLVFESP